MLKRVILFDLDDTLYDYSRCHKKALDAVYKAAKSLLKISCKEFIDQYNLSRSEIHRELAGTASSHNRVLYFQRSIERINQTVEPRLILKLYSTYWDTLLKHAKLRKGALKLLKKLKKDGLKIGIISDLTTHIQLRKIEKLRITDYVDTLVTSEEAGSEKPHKIMFLSALNKLNFLPENAMMVGDNSIADIEGANAVGIDTVLLKTENKSKIDKKGYRKPDYVINELLELTKVIEKSEKKVTKIQC